MLNKNELKDIKEIENKYYMIPVIKRANRLYSKTHSWKDIFDNLYRIITESREEVENLLDVRKENGEIKDKNQTRKSVVGNIFSSILIYTFLKNKEEKNIKKDIFITSKKSQVPSFLEISTIQVGDETQKPDCDLVIYKLDKNNELIHCLILSLKTSLRERAGQTYKWKLLMEISMDENKIKEKYNLVYNPKVKPFVGFVTVNFYDEINNPQQRGMFRFFDKSFIAKPLYDKDFISPLSSLIDFLDKEFI